jgi:alkanesulfonate monooxygenase SsuD/methylene tetrahydromethanopterin reductase-like flavin-dependent oxidoreductase (luciferase family)
MRFGFGGISCQRYPGDPRTDVELYERAVALAEAAEECGYDSVWVAEHHFSDDAFLPSLLPLCAAFAARTRRITIGTAVVLAPLHEPVRLAEDAAVVDLLSHGRFILGLGQGYIPTEFEAFRVDSATRHLRLEDTVATLRQAWSGDLVVGGDQVVYPGVVVTPQPAQPDGPPIWIGGGTRRSIRRAGRIAMGSSPPTSPTRACSPTSAGSPGKGWPTPAAARPGSGSPSASPPSPGRARTDGRSCVTRFTT